LRSDKTTANFPDFSIIAILAAVEEALRLPSSQASKGL